jgi:hypothetical protein
MGSGQRRSDGDLFDDLGAGRLAWRVALRHGSVLLWVAYPAPIPAIIISKLRQGISPDTCALL